MASTQLPTMADMNANEAPLLIGTAAAMMSIAVASVGLRFISRIVTRVPLLLDDWLILATLPFTVAASAISMWGAVYHHFGTHVYATGTVDSVHSFLRGLFVFEIVYACSIAGAKFSMLAIYWRIFPSDHMKWPLLATAGITVCWLIASAMVAVFTCNPIDGFWLFETQPKCINSLAYFLGSAGSNITIDIVMLLIPVAAVMRLKINFSQKVAVSAIFGLGIFVTICSCLRLNQLVIASAHGLNTDPTWDLIGSGVWTDIETAASTVCACLPTMRPLLRLIMHGSVRGTVATRSFGSPRQSMRSSMGQRASYQRPHAYRDSLERSLDRPLSGIEGQGDWLGKGVGMPKTWRTEQGGMSNSPTYGMPGLPQFPVSPPPPAYLQERSESRISHLPPLPSRSPLRRLQAGLSPAGHIPIALGAPYSSRHAPTYSWDGAGCTPDATFGGVTLPSRSNSTRLGAHEYAYDDTPVWGRSRRPSHEPEFQSQLAAVAARQKPLPWTPLQLRTAATDPASTLSKARLEELSGFRLSATTGGDEDEAEKPLQTRRLVRDPATGKYVMSSTAGAERRVPVQGERLSDWEADWEAELDRAAETAWQQSRFASRAASECGSIYQWSAAQSVVRGGADDSEGLPTQRDVAGSEWQRVDTQGGRFRSGTY